MPYSLQDKFWFSKLSNCFLDIWKEEFEGTICMVGLYECHCHIVEKISFLFQNV